MKVTFTLMTIMVTSNIQAMCMSEQLTVFPLQREITANSCVLIEGYGSTQTFIESLSFDTPVSLVSDSGDEIKLNTIEYNQGAFRINQAILKPEKPLTPGTHYTLNFENLDQLEHVPFVLRNDQQARLFTISNKQSQAIAKLLIEPVLIKSETQFFGCGPAVQAEFEFITDSKTAVLVKTQLRDVTEDEIHTYFLKTSPKDTLTVGHGMCSGAFRFNPTNDYEVRFSIMDICNSLTDDWSDWIPFKNPLEGLE